MSDEERKRPSSDDLIRRARERYGSDPGAAPDEEQTETGDDVPSAEEEGLDLDQYIDSMRTERPEAPVEASEEPESVIEEEPGKPEEVAPIEPEPAPEAGPGTIPIQFERERTREFEPETPREIPDAPRPPRRRWPRNIGWILILAFFLLNRCGVIEDIFGDPAGEQLLSALETEAKASGLSDQSWDCIESGLRNDGLVENLDSVGVSELEDALETFPVGAPPELTRFMEGFGRHLNPSGPDACVTQEEFDSLADIGA